MAIFFLAKSSVAIFAELRAPGSCTDRSSGGGKPLIPGSGKKPLNDWTLLEEVYLVCFLGPNTSKPKVFGNPKGTEVEEIYVQKYTV